MSIGTGGLTFFGLYNLFTATFPFFLMFCIRYQNRYIRQSFLVQKNQLTSTCSEVQLSILKDLTLEMCVPILRCSAAHRMQRKTPN